ncbi:MAG TPA: tetratricopeptide repeat protein [Candidatus Acidoferrales bacterium]|nr:tetratricopeptide repeat protein [Candidatus Acidoferrales bacterium]
MTGFVSRAYHQKLNALSQEWLLRGQQDLKSANASRAIVDFRTALVYSPDDSQIQFRLAQGLAELGRDAEARAYLLGLLAQAPAGAPTNLALARLSARAGSVSDALRYYHGAIFGVWPEDPAGRRLETRFELCQFLLGRKDDSDAQAELIALAPEIPRGDAELHARAGDMFVQAGDPTRGLEEYRQALMSHPALVAALRGAGLTEFQLGDYRHAQEYLERAHREAGADLDVTSTLEMTRLVLHADPFAPGLKEDERRERVRADFRQAYSRLETCLNAQNNSASSAKPQQPDLDALITKAKAFRLRVNDTYLRRTEDLNAALEFAFEMEDACTKACGSPRDLDEALILLQKSRQNGKQ